MIDQASVKIDKTEKFVKVSYLINVGKVGKAVGETRSTNVNYYFEFQNRWIDLHASLFPAAKDDDELLAALEQSLSYQALKENLKKP